jgi:hypothetical protein
MTVRHGGTGLATADLLARLSTARRMGTQWIVNHVGPGGKPTGADERNCWWRVPWALIQAGEFDVAAAVLSWAERTAITAEGDLKPGAYGGSGPRTTVYYLSPIAIAAWLLARYGLADRVMGRIEEYQDPYGRGIPDNRAPGSPEDMLKTTQAGISALITGRRQLADDVYAWLVKLYRGQPELPRRLYTSMNAGRVVTTFPASKAFDFVVDFQKSRQAFFAPGIAAAFLAGYAGHASRPDAIQLGRSFLRLNIEGTEQQFDDPESVQICKFGWGAAAMLTADPQGGHLEAVIRMAEWFMDRQESTGSWVPSSFMVREPMDVDRLWKTAEHLMELSMIEVALAGVGTEAFD